MTPLTIVVALVAAAIAAVIAFSCGKKQGCRRVRAEGGHC